MAAVAARGPGAASLRDWLRFYADQGADQSARVSRVVLRVLESACVAGFPAESTWNRSLRL